MYINTVLSFNLDDLLEGLLAKDLFCCKGNLCLDEFLMPVRH